MNKQLDHLFKGKLEGHTVSPSPEAWKKLEGQLTSQRRQKATVWMSIAAGVTILLVSTWLLSKNNLLPNEQLSASNDIEQVTDTSGKNTQEQIEPESNGQLAIQQEEAPKKGAENASNNKKSIAKPIVVPAVSVNSTGLHNTNSDQNAVTTMEAVNTESNEQPPLNIDVQKELHTNEEPIINTPTNKAPVKIIYNLQPVVKVDSSVLREQKEKPKGKVNMFDKIAAFAKNVKVPQDGMLQLRNAKDNLLNFEGLKISDLAGDKKENTTNK